MTDTQAKAGAAQAPSGPSGNSGEAAAQAGAVDAGAPGTTAEPAPESPGGPTGEPTKVVVGRAAVPGDGAGTGKMPSVVSAPADRSATDVRVTAEPPRSPSGGADAPPAREKGPGGTDRPVDVQSVLAAKPPPAEAQTERPKYTRAPGMPAPPDSVATSDPVVSPRSPGKASGTAKVAAGIATGVAAARNPVSAEATVGIRVPGGATEVAAPVGNTGAATGSAPVQSTSRTGRAGAPTTGGRGSRRARLHLKRIDPWSVMKFSFAVSLVLFIVIVIATAVLYVALDTMGVFEAVNKAIGQVDPNGSSSGVIKISATGVLLAAVLIGGINTVLFTALATLGAFIYNVCADLVGGIELTLAEKD
jgi:hypothetical protein